MARAGGAGPPVSTVLLVGTGQVGIRAARQVVDTPGVTRLWVASRDGDRAAELAAIMGPVAEPSPTDAVHVPDGVAVVAVASNRPDRPAWVRAAVRRGRIGGEHRRRPARRARRRRARRERDGDRRVRFGARVE